MEPILIDIRRLVIIKFQDGWSQRKIVMDLNIKSDFTQLSFQITFISLKFHRVAPNILSECIIIFVPSYQLQGK